MNAQVLVVIEGDDDYLEEIWHEPEYAKWFARMINRVWRGWRRAHVIIPPIEGQEEGVAL